MQCSCELAHISVVTHCPCSASPRSSPKPLALAAKLQARVGQAIASLPARDHLPLHLLHHCLSLEASARRGDSAAALHAVGQLQPHAAQLAAPQRCRILAALAGEPSAVVREAACSLLLASMAAEGGLEAAALGPAVLTHLNLPVQQQLRVLTACRQLLAGMCPDIRDSAWTDLCKWMAVYSWNAGSKGARSASSAEGHGNGCAAQLLGEAVRLQALCAPCGAARLERMQSALAASGLAGMVLQQEEPRAGLVAPQEAQPAASTEVKVACSPVAATPSGGQNLQPQHEVGGGSSHGMEGSPAAAPDGSEQAFHAIPAAVAAADACTGQAVTGALPAAASARGQASAPAAAARVDAEPSVAACAAGPARIPSHLSAHDGSSTASLPAAGEKPADTADADMLSDSNSDDAGKPTWLDAVFAAQRRVLGSDAAGRGQAKRRALQPPVRSVPDRRTAGAAPAEAAPPRGPMPPVISTLVQPGQVHTQKLQPAQVVPENSADNADALSLCSS